MKSRWLRIGLPLLGLLIIAAGLEYYFGGWEAVKRELTPPERCESCTLSCGMGEGMFKFPDPVGPEDAKVKIIAYVNLNNHCHYEGCMALKELAEKYPDTVRFEVRNADTEEGQKIARERNIQSLMWLMINDMDKVRLPGRGEALAFRGPPGALSYDLKDVEEVIKYAMTDEGAQDLAKQREELLSATEQSGSEQPAKEEKAGADKKPGQEGKAAAGAGPEGGDSEAEADAGGRE